MARYKYIHCDVYKRGVSVFIGDCESLRKWAKKFYTLPNEQDLIVSLNNLCTDDDYHTYDVAARTYTSNSGQCIVHIPKFSFSYNVSEIANLSHELTHATHNLLDFAGVEYIKDGANESFAYVHEYLLQEALTKNGYKNVK